MEYINLKTKNGQTLEIRTSYYQPPMPLRDCDWSAVLRGYDGGDPMGYGRTEQEAIDDLLDQLDEQALTDEDEYEVYAENERLAGLRPMTLEQWLALDALRREREARRDWRSDDVADLF